MRWSWIALGAGAYIAFAVASFPASTAYHWFAPAELRLSGVSGTAWSGGAALGSVPGLPMRDVRWNVSARSLLLGRVSAELEARLADGFVSTRAIASPSRVRLEDVRASTSLTTLSGLALPVGDARAQLSLSLDEFVLVDGWPVNAIGTLRIADLAVPPLFTTSGTRLIALGSFVVELVDTEGSGIVGTLRDDGGPLEVTNGELRLDPDRSFVLRGLARTRSSASQALVDGVENMMPEPNADGMRPFEIPGSL